MKHPALCCAPVLCCARLVLWCASAATSVSACSRDEARTGPQEQVITGQAPSLADAGEETGSAERRSSFRFEPTLRAHAPAGAEIAPLLEISEPAGYQVRIVVAIERPGEPPAIELMTYGMRNERGVLEPEGPPVPILRVRADQPRASGLEELRRRHAAPGAGVYRPQGLAGADAQEVVARLQAAAATVRDESATSRARVYALAELVKGLDDALVLQRDALPETMDLLLAAGAVSRFEQPSERRATATTASHTLELARKREGWVVVAITPL